tara:strand:- start:9 stop:788 length:780 start_codon:yes stop_codon:yes gene_type:complete
MDGQPDPAAHLNLVWSIVWKTPGLRDKDDAFQEGCLGLIRAAEKFDPERGVTFASYARNWVLAYLRNLRLKDRCIVKIGTTQFQRTVFSNLGRVSKELERSRPDLVEGTNDWHRAMSDELVVPLEVFEEMYSRLLGHDASLDAPIPGFEDTTVLDVQRSTEPLPDEVLNDKRTAAFLADLMGCLSARESDIIRRRYLDGDGATLEAVGQAYGLSRERIRQLEQRALGKMRAFALYHPNLSQAVGDDEVPPLLGGLMETG